MSAQLRSTFVALLGMALLYPVCAAPLAAQSASDYAGVEMRGGFIYLNDGPRGTSFALDILAPAVGSSSLRPMAGVNYWHTNELGSIRAPGIRAGMRLVLLPDAQLTPFFHATANGQEVHIRDHARVDELKGFRIGGGVGGGLRLALDELRSTHLVVEGQHLFIKGLSHWGVTAGLRFTPQLRAERGAMVAAFPVDSETEKLRAERARLEAERIQAEELAAERIAAAEQAAAEARAQAEIEAAGARAAREEAAAAERRAYAALLDLDRLLNNVTGLRETERGLVLTLGQGLFATAQSTLSVQALEEVSRIAMVLQQFPNHGIIVEGHTDSTSSLATNQLLSERRAASVRAALVLAGIDQARIAMAGYGPSRPIADNRTAAGRAQNRRVEIVIIGARHPDSAPPAR